MSKLEEGILINKGLLNEVEPDQQMGTCHCYLIRIKLQNLSYRDTDNGEKSGVACLLQYIQLPGPLLHAVVFIFTGGYGNWIYSHQHAFDTKDLLVNNLWLRCA